MRVDIRLSSASTNLPDSATPPAKGSPPSSTIRAFTSGAASACWTARDRRSTTGAGVPAGANRPFHSYISKPGRPASAPVGTSGSAAERWRPLTASGRSLPCFTYCSVEATLPKNTGTWPPMTSVSAGPPPL